MLSITQDSWHGAWLCACASALKTWCQQGKLILILFLSLPFCVRQFHSKGLSTYIFFFFCLLAFFSEDRWLIWSDQWECDLYLSLPTLHGKKCVLGFLQEAKLTWKKLERVHGSRGLNAQPHVDFIKVAELSQLHYIATSSLAYNTPAPHSKMSKTKKKKLKFISVSYYSPFYRHLICSLWQCCIGNFIHSTSGWRQRANGPVEQL